MTDDISEALRESEQRYRILFEQAPVGVFLYDRSCVIHECNDRFVELLQTKRSVLVGLDMRRLRDQSVLPAIERALSGTGGWYEGPYDATTSSARVCISMRTSPLRDANGEVVGGMGVVEDITERMTALEALRNSEQRLSLHVKKSPLGFIVWDLRFRVLEWNASATRIFGFSEEEAMGRSAMELIVPERARGTVDGVWSALVSGQGGERITNENVTKDGRRIHCDWYNTPLVDGSGQVFAVASLVDDITVRIDAQAALASSELRFRQLIEGAPDAIAVLDDDSRILYANPAQAALLGFDSPRDLEGMLASERIHADEGSILRERMVQILSEGQASPREYRMLRKSGAIVHVDVVSMRIDYDGRPAVLAFSRDMTERKVIQARLLLADRMVSVGTLAAGVAHEINNPLAYVMANLDMIAMRRIPQVISHVAEEGPPEDLRQKIAQIGEMVDIAREGADRVRNIVSDLKAFSRSDDESRGPVDVRHVLDASINMVWNEIRHRAKLVKDYGAVPPTFANEARLGQVFLNLLVNAAQALSVGAARENTIYVRAYEGSGDRVVVEVEDSGPGIPADMIGRIFDPFFTTKPIGVGTGLGLWICHGIVTSLGGQIFVESPPGKGAKFRVSLPHYSHTPRGEPAPSEAASVGGRRGRVLVVDDEAPLAQALEEALIEEHDVVATRSGREALALLAMDERFDVILCDLMMPDVTGMEVYERVLADRPTFARRFVFITGGAFTPRARAFLESVAAPRVDKPFDMPKLLALVRKLVSRGQKPDQK